MSGTSADGLDTAIVDFSPSGTPNLVAFATYPYTHSVRCRILDLAHAKTVELDELTRMDFLLGELFADAVIALAGDAGVPLSSIDYVGSHGQTVRHLPEPFRFCGRNVAATMQIAQPAIIAQRTGVTTISDFRPRDIAAGGHGAPLVPLTDWMLFSDKRITRAVQNIGGIANVTYLPAGGASDKIIAFDTGPGNMIIDHLVDQITGGKKRYDRGGAQAAKGAVCSKTLARLMRNAYFKRKPPKTTGRELFGCDFAEKLLKQARSGGLSDQDILATATNFTAVSIADAYRKHLPKLPDEVILCGGGLRNATLVAAIQDRLPASRVIATDDLGVNADAKEAISFAMLARLTALGAAGNAPSATGASCPVILGTITPADGTPR